MKKRIIKLNRKDFVKWYLDKDVLEGLENDFYNNLVNYGEFKHTADDCFENLGYIPKNLIKNKWQLLDLIKDDEIEEPSSILKVMWVK